MKERTTKIYDWATEKANSPYAPLWIGVLFFLELFLFIPLDAILLFFCLHNPKKTFIYILTGAIASTLSATIGYLIGHFLWDLVGSYIVPNFIAKISFDRISDHFQLYESWTVFLGALTPFPIKALSLAAGVFQLGAISFASYFLMGRLIRFALVGGACLIWGEKLKNFLNRHFHRVLFVIGAKMAVGFLLIWALSQ